MTRAEMRGLFTAVTGGQRAGRAGGRAVGGLPRIFRGEKDRG